MLIDIIMDNTSEYTVLQHHLEKNNYIILLSGLSESPISAVAKELCLALNGVVLDFMHLSDDLQPLNERIGTLTANKGQVIIVKSQSYDKSLIKFYADIHINIGIKIDDIDKSKSYKEKLSTNYVNKYFNYKSETNLEEYIDNIFDFIIDGIEKKVYKNDYETLSHKFYTGEKSQVSRLVSDPKSKSIKEYREEAIDIAEKDIDEYIENDIDDDDEESDEDMLNDSIQIA